MTNPIIHIIKYFTDYLEKYDTRKTMVRHDISTRMGIYTDALADSSLLSRNDWWKINEILEEWYRFKITDKEAIEKINKLKRVVQKPSKMESKKMSVKKSPVKRMTGNIVKY